MSNSSHSKQIRILVAIALVGVGVMVVRAGYAATSVEDFLVSVGFPIFMFGGMAAILLGSKPRE